MATIIISHMPVNAKKLPMEAVPAIPSDMGTPICIRSPMFCAPEYVTNQAAAVRVTMTAMNAIRTRSSLQSFVCVVDFGQAAVRVPVIELYSTGSFQCHGLRDLKFFILHAVRHPDDHLLFVACRRDLQGSDGGLEKSRDAHAGR